MTARAPGGPEETTPRALPSRSGGDREGFFVSYTAADRTWAEWIAWQLEEAGYAARLQAWDFRPGANFVVEMNRATKQAERTLVVLSERYLQSGFGEAEWAEAFGRDPTGEEGLVVPVRIEACSVEGLLRNLVYIDLVDLGPGPAVAALRSGVARGRAKPASPPRYPGEGSAATAERPRFPGTLPPIWSIPHIRNPAFTGREDLLASLSQALSSGTPAALTQAIAGLG